METEALTINPGTFCTFSDAGNLSATCYQPFATNRNPVDDAIIHFPNPATSSIVGVSALPCHCVWDGKRHADCLGLCGQLLIVGCWLVISPVYLAV